MRRKDQTSQQRRVLQNIYVAMYWDGAVRVEDFSVSQSQMTWWAERVFGGAATVLALVGLAFACRT